MLENITRREKLQGTDPSPTNASKHTRQFPHKLYPLVSNVKMWLTDFEQHGNKVDNDEVDDNNVNQEDSVSRMCACVHFKNAHK